MNDFIQAAEEASRIAGALQLEGLRREKQIEFKGSINLVTDVDKACEKAIVEVLQGRFPEHDILAEEGSGRRKDSEYKWIIDPLDGTTNYAHGYRLFCVSIALEHKGEIVVGAVYEPNRDEMFLAEKGGGAALNGEKISVSRVADLNRAMLATGFAYNVRETSNNNLDHFQKFLMKAQAIRRDGVAAIDLCYVAAGRYDGFWELNLFPWDVAAGYLMIQEAGGKVSDFRGKAFDVYSKEILASNGQLHRALAGVLSGS
ncbi:MAG TPA: inositol monophosphatase family protein [bacterium]|nr:inositol monophosphatase family protein [bacterium]